MHSKLVEELYSLSRQLSPHGILHKFIKLLSHARTTVPCIQFSWRMQKIFAYSGKGIISTPATSLVEEGSHLVKQLFYYSYFGINTNHYSDTISPYLCLREYISVKPIQCVNQSVDTGNKGK